MSRTTKAIIGKRSRPKIQQVSSKLPDKLNVRIYLPQNIKRFGDFCHFEIRIRHNKDFVHPLAIKNEANSECCLLQNVYTLRFANHLSWQAFKLIQLRHHIEFIVSSAQLIKTILCLTVSTCI